MYCVYTPVPPLRAPCHAAARYDFCRYVYDFVRYAELLVKLDSGLRRNDVVFPMDNPG